MKKFLLSILILHLIHLIFTMVPTWKFENTAIDLLSNSNEYSYDICKRDMYELTLRLQKTFTRNEGKITQKNILYLDDTKIGEVPWEDIESFYKIYNVPFICPKGKNFLNIYKDKKFTEIIPNDFSSSEDWELLCYYQYAESTMFIAFVNKHPTIYALKLDSISTLSFYQKISKFDEGLYDFKWVTDVNNHNYPMKAITLKNNMITLKGLLFTIEGNINSIKVVETKEKQIAKMLSHSNSYYNIIIKNDNFYFMTYNSASDFTSGYYNEKTEIAFDDIDKINPVVNNISPLEFFNDVEISYLKFIRNSKYLYYKIINNGNDATYHGIIDIELNKVIFNTDEEILEFKPYSYNAMLAITKKSAYKICAIKGTDDNCISECSSGKVVYDILKPNQCYNEIKCGNYILMPNEICIEECDESIFAKNEKQCGLCRDLYKEKPYKLVDYEGCLAKYELPENTMVLNEKLFLVVCKENYYLKDGKCILSCHDLCETCEDYSEDIYDQKCTSCKNKNQVLQEGNCIDECSNGFYLDEKKCMKCSEICETCSKGPNNGLANCLTCNQNSIYKYLIDIGKNLICVEECPKGTILEKINNTCIYQDNNQNNTEQKEKSQENWILWIIIFILNDLFIICIIIICRISSNKKIRSEDLQNHIIND